jgi:integrase
MKKEKQPGDGNVYPKGNVLWLWYYDAKLKRQWLSTELPVGQEKRARASLARIRQDVLKEVKTGVPQGPLTCGRYLDGWLDGRESEGVQSTDDDRSRLKHAESIKAVLMEDLTPDHFRDLMRELKARIGPAKEDLAPRTVRHVYFLLRLAMNDAVADRIIPTNPCVVKKKEIPKKRDKNPFWRETAVFTHAEREQLISDERVPEERRTLYGILFGGGPRISEVSALRVSDYNAQREPLGGLHVSKSYNRKKKKVKGVKTENPRTIPVHPTLAKILGRWLVGGWERYMGRPPQPHDLLLPSGAGSFLKDNTAHANLLQDLKVLGMRSRRTHDSRRTFISLGIADGARKEILKWISHGPTGDIMDDYTTLPWPTLCAEIACMKLELREGRIVQLRKVSNTICDSSCDSGSGGDEMMNVTRVLQVQNAVPRAGLEPDFEGRELPVGGGNHSEALGTGGPQYDPTTPASSQPVTMSQKTATALLKAAKAALQHLEARHFNHGNDWKDHEAADVATALEKAIEAAGGGR